ncbi:MAG: protein translocase subunit SecF [Pyrinomonadaceae bacterium]|nr:protein translocase subunit SecF [Pyrinomonadaceae bacterium]
MFDLFSNINVDWMGIRRPLIAVSIALLLAGLISAVGRQLTPGGTDAFNLGVDFQGGTVITAKFKGGNPTDDEIRSALQGVGLNESVIQASLDKTDEVLIKIPLLEGEKAKASEKSAADEASKAEEKAEGDSDGKSDEKTEANANSNTAEEAESEAEDSNQVSQGRSLVKKALDTFGKEAPPSVALADAGDAKYKIVGTDSVGPVAGEKLRNQAVLATVLGMVGILLFIAFRYDWTYAAGAVIAVFHDVLITLACFTMFQWEISLTVLAALLTLVGFSVNDSIVIFDRIRENLTLDRKSSIYEITNNSINQTMSRTIVTNGLVFLAVLALVLFGGEVLRGFSLALFVGAITGTYSTVAIASPIAIWWQSKLGEAKMKQAAVEKEQKLASAARRSVTRRPVSK